MVWKLLVLLSALLEPAERQSILGDIAERGVDARSLFEVMGLVLLRQLQGITTWKTWLLLPTLWLPALLLARYVERIASYIDAPGRYSYPAYPWVVLDVTILAWTTGFTLAWLGKRGSLIVLSAIPAVFLLGPQGRSYAADHWQLTVAAFALLTVVPGTVGFLQGLQRRPFAVWVAAALLLAIVPTWYTAGSIAAPTLWAHWPVSAMAVWVLLQKRDGGVYAR